MPIAPATPAQSPPQGFGRYILVRELGRGAMGSVQLAVDPDLGRRVALKLVHSGALEEDPELVELLRQQLAIEAKALARLAHPNVLGVYDVGLASGEIYMATEYVEGQTLDRWAAQTRRGWEDVYEVMLGAGRGLAAAHAAGLVHRDFKPANVIVDLGGQARVLDFGLAQRTPHNVPAHEDGDRVVDETQLTGTPAYMAPEQLMGHGCDHRADQFAFCVTFWQLLFGHRPFPTREVRELLPTMRRGPMASPIRRRIPAWLLDSLRQGLAFAPEQRHCDLSTMLDTMEATHRRHRRRPATWTMAMAGIASVGLWTSAALPAWQRDACGELGEATLAIWQAPRKSQMEERFLATAHPLASSSWSKLHPLITRRVEALAEAKVEACRGHGAVLDLQMNCLDRQFAQLVSLVDQFESADDPLIARAVTSIHKLPKLEQCADIDHLRASIPTPQEPALQTEVESQRRALAKAEALLLAGRYDGLWPALGPTLEMAGRLRYRPLQAEAQLTLGRAQVVTGRTDLGVQALERARVHALASGYWRIAAEATIELVFDYGYLQSDLERGWSWVEPAYASLEAAGRPPDLEGRLFGFLGVLHGVANQHVESEQYLLASLERLRDVYGEAHPLIGTALNNLAAAYFYQGRLSDTATAIQRAIEVTERIYGADHQSLGQTYINLSTIYAHAGDHRLALEYAHRSVELCEKIHGPRHIACLEYNLKASLRYRDIGHYRKALARLQRWATVEAEAGRRGGPISFWSATHRAEIEWRRGDIERALRSAQAGVDQARAETQVLPTIIAPALAMLARIKVETGDLLEARALLEEAQLLCARPSVNLDDAQRRVARAEGELALAEQDARRAYEAFSRALKLRQRRSGAAQLPATELLLGLAKSELQLGDIERARSRVDGVIATLRGEFGPGATRLLDALRLGAHIRRSTGDKVAANTMFRQAARIAQSPEFALGYSEKLQADWTSRRHPDP